MPTYSSPRLDASAGAETWVIFSHPNHELAIYGLLKRLQPNLIYLTDGGGAHRVEQTREGLRAIGLAERACFLNHTEQSFYDALVQVDGEFFQDVAKDVRAQISASPSQVFCDAVEFYNPVHDLSLPITVAALKGKSPAPVFEVPLVHQNAENPETCRLQRTTTSREAGQSLIKLSPEELTVKRHAREQIYSLLRGQLGDPLCSMPDEELGIEALVPADLEGAYKPHGCILRYERRARLLRERGEIKNEILHERNFVPIVRVLA